MEAIINFIKSNFSRTSLILGLIFLSLPFISVSCTTSQQGTNMVIGTTSGLKMAYGGPFTMTDNAKQLQQSRSFAPGIGITSEESQSGELVFSMTILLILLIGGILIKYIKPIENHKKAYLYIGGTGLVLVNFTYLYIKNKIESAGAGAFYISPEIGFYLLNIVFIYIIIENTSLKQIIVYKYNELISKTNNSENNIVPEIKPEVNTIKNTVKSIDSDVLNKFEEFKTKYISNNLSLEHKKELLLKIRTILSSGITDSRRIDLLNLELDYITTDMLQ